MLVNQSHDLTRAVAQEAIDALVTYLPNYSAIDREDRGLRPRSIYSLLRLLDSAGWGAESGRRASNNPEYIVEIAWQIFGEHSYQGKGLLERLASSDRGVLGWNELMLFRLQCSADRQGQLYNVHSALIVDKDKNAERTGLVSKLALLGMRRISQEVFLLFKRVYIDSRRNFFVEVNDTSVEAFLGGHASQRKTEAPRNSQTVSSITSLDQRLATARNLVKSFVIYQLSNPFPPNGSGVGCGFYDESGVDDRGGIGGLMNEYVFDFCFNPDVHADNIFLFLDHCLSHLSNPFFSDRDENRYFANKTELPGGLDPKKMGRYWIKHREFIRRRILDIEGRQVVTSSYIASYSEDLVGVFDILDVLACEIAEVKQDADELQRQSLKG